MNPLNQSDYLRLFLEARDVLPGLQLVQDSRTRGADPHDEWFTRCQGQASGMAAWEGPTYQAVQRLVDIRWVFPTDELASTYHRHTLEANSERLPYLQTAPAVGRECCAFGGQQNVAGLMSLTSYMYLFRVGRVVVKLHAAQGETRDDILGTVVKLAQTTERHVSTVLANPTGPGPTAPTMPFQPQAGPSGPHSFPPANPSPHTQPQFMPPPQAYGTRPMPTPSPYSFPLAPPSYPPTPIPSWPPVPAAMPPMPAFGNAPLDRPGSALAVSTGILGILALIAGFPAYLLSFVVAVGEHISRGDEEVLVVSAAIASFLWIPTIILLCLWLYQTWRAIPEQFRSASPGQAVGCLFIPFFNWYWMFRAVPGLSKSLQRAHRALNPHSIEGGGFVMGLLACIFAFIPWLQLLGMLFFFIWVFIANGSKNRLLAAQRSR